MTFFDHLRLLFVSDKAFCRALAPVIGFCPRHPELYREAFRHKSMRGEASTSDKTSARDKVPNTEKAPIRDNERLEYLGDAVLGAICADILYHTYPTQREGFLTTARSHLVQRATLGRIADEMGLGAFIHASIGSPSHNSFLLGNTFEALIGAIWLDRGYDACYRFINQHVIGTNIQLDRLVREDTNPKSRLLERCQKNGRTCEFVLQSETMENGSPVFISQVLIDGIPVGTGRGYTKKESHQNAAREAMRHRLPPQAANQDMDSASDANVEAASNSKDADVEVGTIENAANATQP